LDGGLRIAQCGFVEGQGQGKGVRCHKSAMGNGQCLSWYLSFMTSHAAFAATRWSLILAATDRTAPSAAGRALDDLLRLYWFPLYAYLRRRGLSAHDAQDTTQSFLASLLERESLFDLYPARGKFRSFLLAALSHFLSNQRDHDAARKRGRARTLSFDALSAEARYALEPADTLTPDRLFERRWALALLDQAVARLRAHHAAAGQAALFEALKPALTGDDAQPYGAIAQSLGMSEGAVKVAAHRLRKRYRETLRGLVADTLGGVPDKAAIDEEIAALLGCL
jgi:RNA polymerase sigma-70 factor (ECF subfamily)